MGVMINAHIDERLEPDWKIFRPMSFHALMDLLTFGQLGFTRVHPLWRDGLRSGVPAGMQRRALPRGRANGLARGPLALQSWTLLPAEGLEDWQETDQARPHVCVVSSVGAIARALVAPEGAKVHVECPDALSQPPAHGGLEQARHVHVIVRNQSKATAMQNGCLRFHVDLSTLVEQVVVSSGAPSRFEELIAKLVQANTPADVARAHRHALPAPTDAAAAMPRRQPDLPYRPIRSGIDDPSKTMPDAVNRLRTMRRKATSLMPV